MLPIDAHPTTISFGILAVAYEKLLLLLLINISLS